jgi:hypothetical protein
MVRLTRALVAVLAATMMILAHIAPAGARTDRVQGVFDAGGQRQWISCGGSGSPTLVLAAGLGDTHETWTKVINPLRRMTRVCEYDRPGLGSSPARRTPRTNAGKHARELRALLAAAGEKGPFVMLGHSYAGLLVRAFAAQYPKDVAGVLLLDAVYPQIARTFLPSYHGPWHEGGTIINMTASERATHGGPDLGGTPLVVITAGNPKDVGSWADRKWNAEQARTARLSTNSRHWFAKNSGHSIQKDQPAILIEGVRWLLAQAGA